MVIEVWIAVTFWKERKGKEYKGFREPSGML